MHFAIFERFRPLANLNLLEEVGLGKSPMLTQFLVKQTEFALVRPMANSNVPEA